MIKITPNPSRRASIYGVIAHPILGVWALWGFFIEYESRAMHTERLLTAIPFLFWSFEALVLFMSASCFSLGYTHFSNLRRLRKEAQGGAPADGPATVKPRR